MMATEADIRACHRKVAFSTEEQAMGVLVRQWLEGTYGLHVYCCPNSAHGHYHIGHAIPSMTRQIHDEGVSDL
jgi:hypothetical protein